MEFDTESAPKIDDTLEKYTRKMLNYSIPYNDFLDSSVARLKGVSLEEYKAWRDKPKPLRHRVRMWIRAHMPTIHLGPCDHEFCY